MRSSSVGLAMIVFSGLLIASFAAPMKLVRRFRWENTWLVYATLALVILPVGLVIWAVPHPVDLYRSLPIQVLIAPLLFGFGWGIAQVTFGLSIARVGMAMAFAIVIGLSSLLGSVVPLAVFQPQDLLGRPGAVLLTSAVLLFSGLAVYVMADKRRQLQDSEINHAGSGRGVLLCVFTGCFGSMINMGFVFGHGIAEQAERNGVSTGSATICVWAVVLAAGYLPNLAYTIYLLERNHTIAHFVGSFIRDSSVALLAAVLWLFGMLGYGFGAEKMGKYGNSIGFAAFMAVTLIWSTSLGLFVGEWKSAPSTAMRRMRIGLALILVSMSVLGVGTLIH